jgi:hypothetical protein
LHSLRRGPDRPALFAAFARAAAFASCLVLSATAAPAQVTPTYLFTLSNFEGPLHDDWVRVYVDQERSETYVLYQNVIRVFNASGMEIFSFGDDLDLGQIVDVVVDAKGDILLLSYKDQASLVTRCNYRGIPIAPLPITGLPAGVTFYANRMALRNGLLYFAALNQSTIVITDVNGTFRRRIDMLALLEVPERDKVGAEMIGFTVDAGGNIFVTFPTLFKVYKLAPDGTLTSFGRPGSGTGRFGVIAGIVSDSQGDLLVADKLNCVVLVFDKDFNFISQFGYRGARPENLVAPADLAIDAKDRVYISQGRRRGVSVFALAGR